MSEIFKGLGDILKGNPSVSSESKQQPEQPRSNTLPSYELYNIYEDRDRFARESLWQVPGVIQGRVRITQQTPAGTHSFVYDGDKREGPVEEFTPIIPVEELTTK